MTYGKETFRGKYRDVNNSLALIKDNYYELDYEYQMLAKRVNKARKFIEEWCTINPTTGKCVCYLDKNKCTELYKILGDKDV